MGPLYIDLEVGGRVEVLEPTFPCSMILGRRCCEFSGHLHEMKNSKKGGKHEKRRGNNVAHRSCVMYFLCRKKNRREETEKADYMEEDGTSSTF